MDGQSSESEYEELLNEMNRLERFTDVVAHDLRNPLNVIQGQVALAQEDCESEHLDAIERSATRMNELIDGLLAEAKNEGSGLSLDAVSLRGLAEESWRGIDSKQGTLSIQTGQIVRADGCRLKQLFENLFRNAIEHGGENVTITVGSVDGGFYVEDTGRGIPETERETLLKYGFSTKTDGTGFGLGIVRDIIDRHGWSLTITNSESGGARFEIRGVDVSS